jgi:hypothetical protein
MSRIWRITTDWTFFLAMIAVSGVAIWQLCMWWKAPVNKYPNAREGFGVLALLGLAAYTAYSIVSGYFCADEDGGRILSTVWIVVGMAPFVASLVSPVEGGAPGTIVAGLFTGLALCYRFQRRGWLE